jgi:hypothetical protein
MQRANLFDDVTLEPATAPLTLGMLSYDDGYGISSTSDSTLIL